MYTNERSMGKKQDKLEAAAYIKNYYLIGITETWVDRMSTLRAKLGLKRTGLGEKVLASSFMSRTHTLVL